jgi:hypothetical protein
LSRDVVALANCPKRVSDVANEAAEPCAHEAQLPLVALELFGMGIAAGHHGR